MTFAEGLHTHFLVESRSTLPTPSIRRSHSKSGDTTPCRMTGVTLHRYNPVKDDRSDSCKVTPFILHWAVSPEQAFSNFCLYRARSLYPPGFLFCRRDRCRVAQTWRGWVPTETCSHQHSRLLTDSNVSSNRAYPVESEGFSSYTKVYTVIYDSGSVLE